MDLYCQRCGEPYDIFYVTDEMIDEEKHDFHAGKSCPSCKGRQMCNLTTKCSDCKEYDSGCQLKMFKRPFRAVLAAELGSILGDDLDGLAAEMEDAEWMLGSQFNE